MKVKAPFLSLTLPLILWTTLMIVVSSTPGQKLPEVGLWNFDKFAHNVEFFIFTLLLFRYFLFKKQIKLSNIWRLCIIIGLVYAGLDELHQMLIPNRCCAWQDYVADSAGVLGGVAVALMLYRRKASS